VSELANFFKYLVYVSIFIGVVGGVIWLWLDWRGTLAMRGKDPEQW
jgi:hypothetical protein